MKLIDLQLGQQAWVKSLENLSKQCKRRLIDMGIVEGSAIILVRLMPFGGPVTIESEGQSIGIRRRDAVSIRTESKS